MSLVPVRLFSLPPRRTVVAIALFTSLWGTLRVLSVRESPPPTPLPVVAGRVGNARLALRLATTPKERQRGLMGQSPLPQGAAMYFPLRQPEIPSLWMKNVPVALDIVFLKGGVVSEVRPLVPPCTSAVWCPIYAPRTPVDGVLELRGGEAGRLGIVPGLSFSVS